MDRGASPESPSRRISGQELPPGMDNGHEFGNFITSMSLPLGSPTAGGAHRSSLGSPDGLYDQLSPDAGNVDLRSPTKVKRIAWRCSQCHYHMLAMDHRGKPLPLETDAYGKPLPLYCPRCDYDHVDWEAVDPFDEFGDYANIPSAFSNIVREGRSALPPEATASSFAVKDTSNVLMAPETDVKTSLNAILGIRGAGQAPASHRTQLSYDNFSKSRAGTIVSDGNLPNPAAAEVGKSGSGLLSMPGISVMSQSGHIDDFSNKTTGTPAGGTPQAGRVSVFAPDSNRGSVTGASVSQRERELSSANSQQQPPRKRTAPQAYFCQRCSHRLMRMDQYGVIVPLETDPYGNVVPLRCGGCGEEHNEWEVRCLNGQPLRSGQVAAAATGPKNP